ncbi:MAG: YggS family pyridoxal phosphate-dependent enzyme [Deltaproteobacteria bacterium]|jgi:pyridoxal phosphate enzyme (YggS family)|nr:YggS family pyridoxal phosphate-dependent enzyme [Deltaproteobacteria bacterium]MBT4090391.1 YggS family pyridoxal phosphate-dependent enzyme [Deltaproteobacteria bacterium]MBT4263574.1 YggS family pyridoxal phosphate-dependent enzyme [Deltaproteobacteria bacterium]MBT4644347.1 YggS family pyridoxal phosphate-dependent enzyme [Deltaproteobacteria bacterium]MBT6500428.1 YggS family pyridoxal phosphate-dependent enzyme [Deltaproteobacteria bacterium]
MNRIKDNLAEVLQRIREASAGRDNVKLIAVSKTKPVEMILEAFQAGQVRFGENRVQEARDKQPQLPSEMNWHLIGPLQKNKAKYCPEIFSTIHTIHRFDIAEGLNQKCRSLDKKLDILIQMNLTDEESKSGVTSVDELHALADRIMSLDNLRLTGLMTMGDFHASDDENRKMFARLFEINQQEAARLDLKDQMVEISSGMSGDFELALMEGATYVRIGSAIFGSR